MGELKPCPFCGKGCIIIADESDVPSSNFKVVCDFRQGGCGASGGTRRTEDEAVAAWNTRAERTCRAVPMDCFGNEPYNKTGLNGNASSFGCSECGFPWHNINLGSNCITSRVKACPNCGAKVVE